MPIRHVELVHQNSASLVALPTISRLGCASDGRCRSRLNGGSGSGDWRLGAFDAVRHIRLEAVAFQVDRGVLGSSKLECISNR